MECPLLFLCANKGPEFPAEAKGDILSAPTGGTFPCQGKGKGPLAQSPLPLRPPPETWGTPPYTVTAIRFPALMGRQSCHFLESTSLYPPPAALWCFLLWKPLPGTGDEGRGPAFGNQPPRGRETKDGGAAAEREVEGVLFAPRCAPCPQMLRRTDLRFRYSAAGRGVSSSVGSS